MATIGIHIPITTVPETVTFVQRAERLGVQGVWLTSGGFGPDSLTTLAVVGAQTERIRLGSSIVVAYSRHPLVMAQQSLAISDVAPGRFRLGIGIGHRPIVEGTYGLSFERPTRFLHEYVAVLRQALDGEVAVSGETFKVNARLARPHHVPIYISALRTSGYRLAGEIADGAISWATPPAFLADVALPAMRETADAAGRARPRLVGHAMALVTDDPEPARLAGRERLAANTRQPFYQDLFADAGYPEARDGNVSDALLSELVLVGHEDAVARGLGRLIAAGCDELVVTVLPGTEADLDRTLRLVAQLA